MRFNIALCTSLLVPIFASAGYDLTVRAKKGGGNHHLEIEGVSGDRTRLSFQWDDKKGFRLTETSAMEANPGWGWGIGAFNYVKNGERVVVGLISLPQYLLWELTTNSATLRVDLPRMRISAGILKWGRRVIRDRVSPLGPVSG